MLTLLSKRPRFRFAAGIWMPETSVNYRESKLTQTLPPLVVKRFGAERIEVESRFRDNFDTSERFLFCSLTMIHLPEY